MSLGVSGDAPQMYSKLEEKLGSGTNIDGLQDVRVVHYCPYKVVHCCHRNPNIKNKDGGALLPLQGGPWAEARCSQAGWAHQGF